MTIHYWVYIIVKLFSGLWEYEDAFLSTSTENDKRRIWPWVVKSKEPKSEQSFCELFRTY